MDRRAHWGQYRARLRPPTGWFVQVEIDMSWMGTLAKVGMGVMVAKGVGKMMQGGTSGGGGGLGGMLGGMMGQQGAGQAGGGLGGMLGGMMGGQQGRAGGGIGDMLGGLMGGGAAAGGLGSILAGRGGNGAQQSGGLGGLLDSLGGGNAMQGGAGAPPQAQQGGFGGALNSAFENFGEPEQAPTPSQEDAAKVMLRAMLTAAKSDGQIDDGEKEKILGHLGDISQDEMAFVRDELSAPIDVEGLVRDIPQGMEQQAYLMSVMAIDLDSADEARYLDGLAKALGIDAQTCNAIHDKLGAPKLYT